MPAKHLAAAPVLAGADDSLGHVAVVRAVKGALHTGGQMDHSAIAREGTRPSPTFKLGVISMNQELRRDAEKVFFRIVP